MLAVLVIQTDDIHVVTEQNWLLLSFHFLIFDLLCFGIAYCCLSFNDTATWCSLSAFRLKLDIWVLCELSRHQTELQPSNVSVCNGNAIMAILMDVNEHWPFWLFVSMYIYPSNIAFYFRFSSVACDWSVSFVVFTTGLDCDNSTWLAFDLTVTIQVAGVPVVGYCFSWSYWLRPGQQSMECLRPVSCCPSVSCLCHLHGFYHHIILFLLFFHTRSP